MALAPSKGADPARTGGAAQLEDGTILRLPFRTVALIAVLLAGIVFLISLTPPLRQFEAWSIDFRLRQLAPPSPSADEIVIVGIDERVLARLPYRSPLDRAFLADLLEGLFAASPGAIGLDILFDRASEAAKDDRLRNLLRDAPVPLVVASGDRADGLTAAQLEYLRSFTEGVARGEAVLKADVLDGRIRSVAGREAEGAPTFAGALFLMAEGTPPSAKPFFLAPVPSAKGPAFRTLPASVIAQGGPALQAWIGGRTVLVGALLPGEDRHNLGAGGGDAAGVVVHAHILARLQDGFQPRAAPAATKPLLLLLAASLGTVLAALRMPETLRGAVAGAVILAIAAAGFACAAFLVIIPVTPTIQAFFLAAAFTRGKIAAQDRVRRRFLQRAFGKYVAPSIIRQLIDHPERLQVGGERREITALFTDLEGFTAMTELLPPESMVVFLNGYLDGICQVIARFEGTMDKIVGDAVVCMFNAPVDQPDHALRAVRCALEIDAFACGFVREQSERLGHAFGRTRIGVATGLVTVGNFGGDVVFDYTAHGPAMNLAARLEGANRDLGTSICVDGRTARACPEVSFEAMGTVRAKGFAAPVPVFKPNPITRELDHV